MRWGEEVTLTTYEMEWTVRYFIHKSNFWAESKTLPGICPRTLIYVENWCSYEIISVHLPFLLVFHGFDNIFISCHPNNMIYSTF
jgi:hypothetical protein